MIAQAIRPLAEALLLQQLPGGTPDPDGGRLVGHPWELGKESQAVFFRKLAELITPYLEEPLGVPGHGSAARLRFEQALGQTLEGLLLAVGSGMGQPWEQWWQQSTTPSGAGPALTTDQLRQRLLEYLDLPSILAAVRAAESPDEEEPIEDDEDDTLEDVQETVTDFLKSKLGPGAATLAVVLPQRLAAATAVAAAAPPGSAGSTLWDGARVHRVIQAHYRQKRASSWIVQERSVFTPGGQNRGTLAQLVGKGTSGVLSTFLELALVETVAIERKKGKKTSRLRPDILDLRPPAGEVYEIKSRRQAVPAVVYVDGWCAAYNALRHSLADPRLLPLVPGGTYIPPRLIPLSGTRIALPFIVPGLEGLLLYDVFKRPDRRWEEQLQTEMTWLAAPDRELMMKILVAAAALIVAVIAIKIYIATAPVSVPATIGALLISGGILSAG